MSGGSTPRGATVAVVLMIACCALLPAIAVGAGLLSAAAGIAVRFWPLTLTGIVVVVWAGVRIAQVVRRRREALGQRQVGQFTGSEERP